MTHRDNLAARQHPLMKRFRSTALDERMLAVWRGSRFLVLAVADLAESVVALVPMSVPLVDDVFRTRRGGKPRGFMPTRPDRLDVLCADRFLGGWYNLCVKVVGIHGINQHRSTREELCGAWADALRKGLDDAGADIAVEVDVAYFADLYVEHATEWKAGDEPGELDGIAAELVLSWAVPLSEEEDEAYDPAKGLGIPALPLTVQSAVQRLAAHPGMEGLGVAGVRRMARHMHGYLCHDDARELTLARVDEAMVRGADVLIGHSMGSVVAYEWAHRHPAACPPLLLTIGSPLGCVPVLSRLRPPPAMPTGPRRWVNVAGSHDPIAWPKKLATIFGSGVEDRAVGFEFWAHAARTYLRATQTATAVAAGA